MTDSNVIPFPCNFAIILEIQKVLNLEQVREVKILVKGSNFEVRNYEVLQFWLCKRTMEMDGKCSFQDLMAGENHNC